MKKLLVVFGVLLLLVVGAWLVAQRMESPAQVAARAEPPPPLPVTAPMREGFLHAPVSLETRTQFAASSDVKAPSSLSGVITHVEDVTGQELGPGESVVRINGRPLFALSGPFALYRDIDPGATGDDVAAIQESLRAAGYSVGGDKAGTYGRGTQSAIRRMYANAGFTPPAAPDSPTQSEGREQASSAGIRISRAEVLMLPELPVRVQKVAPIGTELTPDVALLTLGSESTALSATLPTSALGALSVGAEGSFTDADGREAIAQLSDITPGAAESESVVTFTTPGRVEMGASYVVTIENPAQEDGHTILVPISAIVARGGNSYIYVKGDAEFTELPVTVVGSVGGVAGIKPLEGGADLPVGSEVRIG